MSEKVHAVKLFLLGNILPEWKSRISDWSICISIAKISWSNASIWPYFCLIQHSMHLNGKDLVWKSWFVSCKSIIRSATSISCGLVAIIFFRNFMYSRGLLYSSNLSHAMPGLCVYSALHAVQQYLMVSLTSSCNTNGSKRLHRAFLSLTAWPCILAASFNTAQMKACVDPYVLHLTLAHRNSNA